MKLKTTEKPSIRFIIYFIFIQIINSDNNFILNYDMGKKIILSFLTAAVFLLATHFIEKKLNNMRDLTSNELNLISGAGLDKDASVPCAVSQYQFSENISPAAS